MEQPFLQEFVFLRASALPRLRVRSSFNLNFGVRGSISNKAARDSTLYPREFPAVKSVKVGQASRLPTHHKKQARCLLHFSAGGFCSAFFGGNRKPLFVVWLGFFARMNPCFDPLFFWAS